MPAESTENGGSQLGFVVRTGTTRRAVADGCATGFSVGVSISMEDVAGGEAVAATTMVDAAGEATGAADGVDARPKRHTATALPPAIITPKATPARTPKRGRD